MLRPAAQFAHKLRDQRIPLARPDFKRRWALTRAADSHMTTTVEPDHLRAACAPRARTRRRRIAPPHRWIIKRGPVAVVLLLIVVTFLPFQKSGTIVMPVS
jgi:hypothetical protein